MFTREEEQLWQLMQKIDECWRTNQPHKLSAFFHENILFNSPDMKHQLQGAGACIQTYVKFLSSSAVLNFEEGNPRISVYDRSAVVTYNFEMKYEQNNMVRHEAGTDIMFFSKVDGSWKAVWRLLTNVKDLGA